MKQSGVATFLLTMGIIFMVLGRIGGLFTMLTTGELGTGVSYIIGSLAIGAVLLGISEIINIQLKIFATIKKQGEQVIQKCPECGKYEECKDYRFVRLDRGIVSQSNGLQLPFLV